MLAAEREKFIAGAKAKGYSADTAETVYAYIDRFANYGFNRSHAVAYSMVAFWLAYLKEHYPAAFFTALMNASLNNTAKLRVYLQEARHRKLTVLGPDINASAWTFTLSHGAIRFGFMSVKGMRRDFVEAVLTARQAGPFKSLRDVLQRLDVKWLKPDHFLPLIDAGAFDSFSQNRAATTAGLDELIESVRLAGNDVELFSVLQPKPVAIPDYGATERLDREAAVLGVYLSGHPVDRYVAALRPYQPVTAVADLVVPQTTTVVLVIRRIKRIRTKKRAGNGLHRRSRRHRQFVGNGVSAAISAGQGIGGQHRDCRHRPHRGQERPPTHCHQGDDGRGGAGRVAGGAAFFCSCRQPSPIAPPC